MGEHATDNQCKPYERTIQNMQYQSKSMSPAKLTPKQNSMLVYMTMS